MPQDIRKLMEEFKEEPLPLTNKHEEKFINKLKQEFPKKNKPYKWLYIATSIVILLGVGITFYPKTDTEIVPQIITRDISLGNISPEMQKIESYYLTAINYEMASLQVTPENKALLDEYFEKISKLDIDYKRLNLELENNGINNETINALITNLQLRLQLLIQLKDQVSELQSKHNNNESNTI